MAKKTKEYDPPEHPNSVGWTVENSVRLATAEQPFALECGAVVGPVDVEYEAYGTLSPAKDNAVLITHALSGDAHVAGWDKNAESQGRLWRSKKPGWWDTMIGPGKPLDTNKYFILCSNFLGSCYGTTGPSSINPATGKPYGLAFPNVTVSDWVKLQARLLDKLGIERLLAVVGGSLGGQQALEWGLAFPDRVAKCIVLAASARLSVQGLAFNAVGRYSIMHDPNFSAGDYYDKPAPQNGLAAARMLAHITYLSEAGMHEKFGRRANKCEEGFGVEFEVESYLNYQGKSFVERFDANSYLYITRAMDTYDAAAQWGGGDLVEACKRMRSEVMVVSFSSDWLYLPAHCRDLALALSRNGRSVTYVDVPSRYGHDAFLVETKPVGHLLTNFLRVART
ncbi:MAG TPA: homoserine O-acetyltransferase [Planctomycetota bacterium]|jgi:homoserine O-acetyltransferase